MKDKSPNRKFPRQQPASAISLLLPPVSVRLASMQSCLPPLYRHVRIISAPFFLSGGSILGGRDSEKDLSLNCNFPCWQPWLIY